MAFFQNVLRELNEKRSLRDFDHHEPPIESAREQCVKEPLQIRKGYSPVFVASSAPDLKADECKAGKNEQYCEDFHEEARARRDLSSQRQSNSRPLPENTGAHPARQPPQKWVWLLEPAFQVPYFTPQPYGLVCVTATFSPASSFWTASRT